jgi:uncharacterized protein YuzE
MNLNYLPDSDLLYIYLESNTPNVQARTNHKDIFKFVAKTDKNKIIGYEVEKVSKNLNFVLTKLNLTSKEKLAICLYYIRTNKKNTQEQIADLLQISLSKYKSLEKADHNINFDTLDNIFENFPNESILETVFHKAS